MTQHRQRTPGAGTSGADNPDPVAAGAARSSPRAALGARSETSLAIAGISVPDSKLAHEITELVRDTESLLLFHYSSRVFYWAAMTGARRGLKFDAELLYAGAMFHDMGLMHSHSSPTSASRSTAPTRRETSCAATEFRNRISTRCGPRSRCTPRRAFHSTCIR